MVLHLGGKFLSFLAWLRAKRLLSDWMLEGGSKLLKKLYHVLPLILGGDFNTDFDKGERLRLVQFLKSELNLDFVSGRVLGLYKEPQVIQVIRSNKLRWLGHIWRSPENNQTRAYTFKNPMGSRKRGRSPTRWIDDVVNDLKTLNIKTWQRVAAYRWNWRNRAVEAAKTYDIPVCHLSCSEKLQVDDQIDDWLQQGIIKESVSDYCSPIVLCKKKDGNLRLCIDYRKINSKTEKDRYPLPLIEEVLDLQWEISSQLLT
ncbi:endonuclease-reverse transcriptase [Trichonephila clavipes]|nr:endonuclease-reverse transcriptase [Trichonephila clavipes]